MASYNFDLNGQVIEIAEAATSTATPVAVVQYGYSADGNPVLIINDDGTIETNQFDAASGKISQRSVEDTATSVTSVEDFTYDAVGNLTQYENAAGEIWTYTHDTHGNVLVETKLDPDGAGPIEEIVTTYGHDDPIYNLVTSISIDGVLYREFEFGTDDLPTSLSTENGWESFYEYTPYGQIKNGFIVQPSPDGPAEVSIPFGFGHAIETFENGDVAWNRSLDVTDAGFNWPMQAFDVDPSLFGDLIDAGGVQSLAFVEQQSPSLPLQIPMADGGGSGGQPGGISQDSNCPIFHEADGSMILFCDEVFYVVPTTVDPGDPGSPMDPENVLYFATQEAIGVEGNSFEVVVGLHREYPQQIVEVDIAASGIANLGPDYTLSESSLRFEAYETEKTILVALRTDTETEMPETFELTLANPSGAIVSDTAGHQFVGTIYDLDDPDASGGGDSGTGDDPGPNAGLPTVYFETQVADGPEGQVLSVNVAISSAPATGQPVFVTVGSNLLGHSASPGDFRLDTTQVEFLPGETGPKPVLVTLLDDDEVEETETFGLELNTAIGANIDDEGGDYFTGLIENTTPDGMGGSGSELNFVNLIPTEFIGREADKFDLTLYLSEVATSDVVVTLEVDDDAQYTATDGVDFLIPQLVVTIPAGDLFAQTEIGLIQDFTREETETFRVRIEDVMDDDDEVMGGPSSLFDASIIDVTRNSVPVFSSEPVRDAYVGTEYRYESTATDADGDLLVYSIGTVTYPDGYDPSPANDIQFEYDAVSQRGIYTWNAPGALAGQSVFVEEIVWDLIDAPVYRPFEIYVHPTIDNSAPVIVSEPSDNHQLQVDLPADFGNDDGNVTPEFIEVSLANGEEIQVNVSIDASLAQATADIVFAVDLSGSMEGAIRWLAESIDSIEQQLTTNGVTNNRYGLVIFGQNQEYYFGESGQAIYVGTPEDEPLPPGVEVQIHEITRPTSIAIGRVDLTEGNSQHPFSVPFADLPPADPAYEDQVWGTAQQLAAVLRGSIAEGNSEYGQEAIARFFDPNPTTVDYQPTQIPYDFRPNAVIDVVLVTDEPSDDFDQSVQAEIQQTLEGNPDIDSDNILFTSIASNLLTGNDGEDDVENFGDYIINSSNTNEIQNTDNYLSLAPSTTNNEPLLAVIDIEQYQEETAFYDLYCQANVEPCDLRGTTFASWSASVDFVIDDLGAGYDQNARIVFGPDAIDSPAGTPLAPSDYWYLEADALSDKFFIGSTNSGVYDFELHEGAAWPNLRSGETVSVELRLLEVYPETDPFVLDYHSIPRFDLFVNGDAIGSVVVPDYHFAHVVGGAAQVFNPSIGFIGVGSNNSGASFDHLEINSFDRHKGINPVDNIAPDEPTPYDFSENLYPARIVYSNDFGSVDGSSYDLDIVGANFGGASYRLTRDAGGDFDGMFERLENPGIARSYEYTDTHYGDLAELVNGSAWDLNLLRDRDPVTGEYDPADANTLNAFTGAFADSIAHEILQQSVTIVADSTILTGVESFYDPDPEAADQLSFRVTLTGNGSSDVFQLRFVDVNANNELGSLPVVVSAKYAHDFRVTDFENDEPYEIFFDPDYVDDNGVITHGAVLVNSGNTTTQNGRLIWEPDASLLEGEDQKDFHFRVLVRDSAGSVSGKNWDVTLYASDAAATNNLPIFDVSGLDPSPSMLVDAVELPDAQELRGYSYHVLASDPDEQDQGNLRYYIIPAETDSGSRLPLPTWISIDRNTGELTGRPGTADIGDAFFNVVVTDNRITVDDNPTPALVEIGKTVQTFAIHVDERDTINTAPHIDPIPDFLIRANKNFTYPVVAYDSDSDALTYSILAGPDGLTIDSDLGIVNWTPIEDQADQSYAVVVGVSDGTATSNEFLELFVVPNNREPIVTTELEDGVTWQPYRQKLTATDPDGNIVRFSLLRSPDDLNVAIEQGTNPEDQTLVWNNPTAGLHLFAIRATDGAGSVVDRYYYVEFTADDQPQLVDVVEPVWRQDFLGEAVVTITTSSPLSSPSTDIYLDNLSTEYGLTLSVDPAEHITTGGADYWKYTARIAWTPEFEGEFDVQVTVDHGTEVERFDLELDVTPSVDTLSNTAPAFAESLLGPFARNSQIAFPIPVADAQGHQFQVTVTDTSIANPSEIVIGADNVLRWTPSQSGLFYIHLTATEESDLGQTGWGATSEHVYSVFVEANASPVVYYDAPEDIRFGEDYTYTFVVSDPNVNDALTVRVNSDADAAGVEIVPGTSPDEYELRWPASAIDDWVGGPGGQLPSEIPIIIEAFDNYFEPVSFGFNIPIVDPAASTTGADDYALTIPAGRLFQFPIEVDNPAGHGLTYSLAPALPTTVVPVGLEISSDGLVQWLPSVDLLNDPNNPGQIFESLDYSFVVSVDVNDSGVVTTLTSMLDIQLQDPTFYDDPFVPEFDQDASPLPQVAVLDQAFAYQASLVNSPSDQIITWSLDIGPEGMTINPDTGLISWTPTNEYVGENVRVRLRASSQQAGASLTFFLDVRGSNSRPLLDSSLPTVWQTGATASIQLSAFDADNDPLKFELLDSSGASVTTGPITVSESGLLDIDDPNVGQYDLTLRISEQFNPSSYLDKPFFLEVSDTATNLEPLFLNYPRDQFVTTLGETPYQFLFNVLDPDQSTGLIYSIFEPENTTATIDQTGLFSWQPTASELGVNTFKVLVQDTSAHSGEADNIRHLTFDIEAIENNLPVVLSRTDFTQSTAAEFVHQINAFDPENDSLTYSLEQVDGQTPLPTGLNIDQYSGQIRWQVGSTQTLATYPFNVIIEDERGAATTHLVSVTVDNIDRIAPTLSFRIEDAAGNIVSPSDRLDGTQDYTLWIDARDNSGSGSWTLFAENSGSTLINASGGLGLWYVPLTAGTLGHGLLNLSTSVSDGTTLIPQEFRYFVEDAQSFDIAAIISVGENGEPISDRVDVIGNAEFTGGVYDLVLTSLNDPDDFVYLARGQDAIVNGTSIGSIDATLLPSGHYRLHLEVRDSDQLTTVRRVDERIIEIDNRTRFGNLDLSFSDLDVSLGGIPISLIRTYDSGLVLGSESDGNGGFGSDFTAGWNLSLLNSRLTVSHPEGITTGINQPFAHGTRVQISLPDGSIHRFTFDPIQQTGSLYTPYLRPDVAQGSTLGLRDVDPDLQFVLDTQSGIDTYLAANSNQVSIPGNFGTAFVLTTAGGTDFIFDIKDGSLEAIEDLNGARIEVERLANEDVEIRTVGSGTGNQNGTEALSIIRDSEGRIESIEAPRQTVNYIYNDIEDVNGNLTPAPVSLLVAVETDGDAYQNKVVYSYDNLDLPRHLTSIVENGVQVLAIDYFDSADPDETFGRVNTVTNAGSAPSEFSFEIALDDGTGRKVRTSNSTGVTVEEVLDRQGNVLATIRLVHDDPNISSQNRYLVYVSRYNARGLRTHQSRPFYVTGAADRFNAEPPVPPQVPVDEADTDYRVWSSYIRYDSETDRIISQQDSGGGITTFFYDYENGIFSTTDPTGFASHRVSDPVSGRILETYTTVGDSTERQNLIRHEYDYHGRQIAQIQILADSEVALSRTGYDDNGFVAWRESVSAQREYYGYDSQGSAVLKWRQISEPGEVEVVTIVERSSYNGDLPDPTGDTMSAELGPTIAYQTTFEVHSDFTYDETNSQSLKDLLADYDQWLVDFEDGQDPDEVAGIFEISKTTTFTNRLGRVVSTDRTAIGTNGVEVTFHTRAIFDDEGRVLYQTDEYQSDTQVSEISGTHTIYLTAAEDPDNVGLVARTERLTGLEIEVFDDIDETINGVFSTSQLVGGGSSISVLSFSENTYLDDGRIESSTSYSLPGPVETNESGLTTQYFYNLNGQTTKTVSEAWGIDGEQRISYVSYTVFDDQDRVYLQTDSFVEGEVAFATRTIYDEITGQAIGSERLRDVVIQFGDSIDPHRTTIAENGEGESLYSSHSVYGLGRLVASIDAGGGITNYEYDALGRQVATIGVAVTVAGTQGVRHRTETVYDQQGRASIQRSGIIHDSSGDGHHDETHLQETRYQFDDAGNLVRTEYGDGSYALVRYDSLGRRVAESQQVAASIELTWSDTQDVFVDSNDAPVPTRSSEYDSQGRLVAVILPLVQDFGDSNGVDGENDFVRPRYEYEYDVRGNQTVIRDPLSRETQFTFDEFGRQTSRTLPLGLDINNDPITDPADDNYFTEFFEYDDYGRQIVHVSFEGVRTESVYDDKTGRLTETLYVKIGEPDERREYIFDDRGRQTEVVHFHFDMASNSFVVDRHEITLFNEQGQIESVQSPEGFRFYEYDDLSRQTRVSFSGSEFTGTGSDFQNVTEFGYDVLGRLSTVTVIERNDSVLGTPEETSYAYDLTGNLDQTHYANEIVHDYVYDQLNRLDFLRHYFDANGDGIFNENPDPDDGIPDDREVASFDYHYEGRADGKRTGVTETFYTEDGSTFSSNQIDWSYDALGRLISESFDHDNDIFDSESFVNEDAFIYDIVGNRLTQVREKPEAFGGVIVETTDYQYDANDRLDLETKTVEAPDLTGGTTSTITTSYDYDKTQQTYKEVVADNVVKTVQQFDYDLQGRLQKVLTTTLQANGIDIETYTETTYEYDASGNRVASEVGVSEDNNTSIESVIRTEFLTDAQNHTGYSQVLKETQFAVNVNGSNGAVQKEIIYTIGHDQISQTVTENGETATHFFGADGHGSVRVLYDTMAKVVNELSSDAQIFHFDAYGNLLNLTDGQTPLTSYLYSGEAFDFNIGQQYLRARFYDPISGRFNRLDPFYGNSEDPQSFHKYAYVHGDPIQGIDPSGLLLTGMFGVNQMFLHELLSENGLLGLFDRQVLFTNRLKGFGRFLANQVPVVGPAFEALWSWEEGNYGWAAFNFGLAFADLLTLGAAGKVTAPLRAGPMTLRVVTASSGKGLPAAHVLWKVKGQWFHGAFRNAREGKASGMIVRHASEVEAASYKLRGWTVRDVPLRVADTLRAGPNRLGKSCGSCIGDAAFAYNGGNFNLPFNASVSITGRAINVIRQLFSDSEDSN